MPRERNRTYATVMVTAFYLNSTREEAIHQIVRMDFRLIEGHYIIYANAVKNSAKSKKRRNSPKETISTQAEIFISAAVIVFFFAGVVVVAFFSSYFRCYCCYYDCCCCNNIIIIMLPSLLLPNLAHFFRTVSFTATHSNASSAFLNAFRGLYRFHKVYCNHNQVLI